MAVKSNEYPKLNPYLVTSYPRSISSIGFERTIAGH